MYGTRWLKKFCKGDESLEDEGCSGQPLEVDNNQLRGSLKLILIQLHKKLPKNSGSTILWSAGIWSKLERWKSLISGCLMSWPKIQKTIVLKCSLLLFYAVTTSHLLTGLWYATKSGLYIATSNAQLNGWTERLQSTSQNQTCTKKRSWSQFGALLPVWYTTAFWIPVKPLHLRSMFSKSMLLLLLLLSRFSHVWLCAIP